jgi:hypothetical protein
MLGITSKGAIYTTTYLAAYVCPQRGPINLQKSVSKKNPFHKFTEAMLRLQPYAFQARHFQGIRLNALELPP